MFFGTSLALLLSYRCFPAALEPALRMTPVVAAPPTTLMLAFPSLVRRDVHPIGQAVHFAGRSEASATARLTIANTIGCLLGSCLTGFHLIPVFGLEECFVCDLRLHRPRGLARRGAGTYTAYPRAHTRSSFCGARDEPAALPGGVMRDVYQSISHQRAHSRGRTPCGVPGGTTGNSS